MIEMEYTVKHIRRLSDYCERCPYLSLERVEMETLEDDKVKEVHEFCANGNLCDRLYARLERLNE